jgi:hypothetical protein
VDQSPKEVTHYADGIKIAFAILTKCLLKNRALNPGQFSQALKAIFNEPDADIRRPDYQFLAGLAQLIDDEVHETAGHLGCGVAPNRAR